MNKENSNEINYNDEEISLKELITVVLNEKKLIAIITIIAIALSAVYSFVVLKTEYENDVLISADIITENIETPYGAFRNPYRTLDQYIRMVKNPEILKMTARDMDNGYTYKKIEDLIKTEVVIADRAFRINVKGNDSDEAYQLVKTHTNNFIQYLQYDLTYRAINDLYNKNDSDINILEKKLEKNNENLKKEQELLKDTPKTIDLENALLSQTDYSKFVSNGVFDSNNFKGQRIISQEVHPSYIIIVDKITNLELEKSDLLNSIEIAEKNKEALAKDIEAMTEYQEVPTLDELNIGISQAMKNLIVVAQNPQFESEEIAPRYKLNIAIALVLGLMLGVFVAFFKDYWKKS